MDNVLKTMASAYRKTGIVPTCADEVITQLLGAKTKEEANENISAALLDFLKPDPNEEKTTKKRRQKVPITAGRCLTEEDAKAMIEAKKKMSPSTSGEAAAAEALSPRKRGWPRKHTEPAPVDADCQPVKRGRGRPRKAKAL